MGKYTILVHRNPDEIDVTADSAIIAYREAEIGYSYNGFDFNAIRDVDVMLLCPCGSELIVDIHNEPANLQCDDCECIINQCDCND